MTSLLARFRPNFGVIDGDLVSGYAWDDTNPIKGWYESKLKQVTSPFRFTKTKYAVTLGNHDA